MEVLALKMKNNIKERRKARGLRQEDMAKLLGVSRQTIVAMENDSMTRPSSWRLKPRGCWNSRWRVYSSLMKNRENGE